MTFKRRSLTNLHTLQGCNFIKTGIQMFKKDLRKSQRIKKFTVVFGKTISFLQLNYTEVERKK